MVYPTLLAVIGDVAHPVWRASAVGVYRLWRDAGFAVGALLAGVIADRLGIGGRHLDGRPSRASLACSFSSACTKPIQQDRDAR